MIFDLIKARVRYPKLLLLLISILGAYILFQADIFLEIAAKLNAHGYVTIFFAGLFFSYGFTAPIAVAAFVALAPQVNIFLAAALAGAGALISDFLIFKYIRTSFQDEFDKLKLTHLFLRVREQFDRNFSRKVKQYLLWTIAGLLIASPLPDEFGVSLLSGLTTLNKKVFSCVSYVLNTTGIFVILVLARFGI